MLVLLKIIYGSIKRMLQSSLIAELVGDNPRRKYYTIIDEGRKALAAELERYNDAVDLVRRTGLLGHLALLDSAL